MIDVETVIADTRALIAVDSTNPGKLEADAANWVEQRLVGMGLQPTRHPVQPGRDNLAVTIPGRDRDAPRFVVVSHMDTVPIGEGWTRPPLGGVIENGLLYGRGACDMKSGLALTLGLLEALQRTGTTPASDVVAFYTVDEEAPGMLGFLFAADDAVALEPEAVKALRDDAPAVLDAALAALALVPTDGFVAEPVHVALQEAIVDALGIKPRFAFAPLRTAISGRRVSPPLFESMEILGKDSSIARLAALRDTLA